MGRFWRYPTSAVAAFVLAVLVGLLVALVAIGGDLHVPRVDWGAVGGWVVGAVIAFGVLVWSFRPVDPPTSARWLVVRGAQPTDEAVRLIGRFLGSTRAARAFGAVVGLQVSHIPALLWRLADPGSVAQQGSGSFELVWMPLAVLGGYAVGAVVAELLVGRSSPSRAARRASLRPRQVSGIALWGPRVLAGLLVVLLLMGLMPPPYVYGGVRPRLVPAVLAVVVLLVVEVVRRRLLRRPQALDDPGLIAADDAARSSTVHAVTGAGLAFQLLALSAALESVVLRPFPLLGLVASVVAWAAWPAALLVVWWFGTRLAWSPRRLANQRVAA